MLFACYCAYFQLPGLSSAFHSSVPYPINPIQNSPEIFWFNTIHVYQSAKMIIELEQRRTSKYRVSGRGVIFPKTFSTRTGMRRCI